MTFALPRRLAPLGVLLAIAGCSLINGFDEVAGFSADNTGGFAGASSGSGGGSGGQGGAPVVEVEPGLVVVGGQEDGAAVLLSLSPQTGEELARLTGNYGAAVHEAERDLWFLIQGDEVRAARFDRRQGEWAYESEAAQVVAPVDPVHVFALNGNLAVLGDGGELSVFDTKDLSDVSLKGTAQYPDGLWGTVGAPSSAGGEVHVLSLDCPGAPERCVVELRRIQVDGDGVQEFAPVKLVEAPVTSPGASQGSIGFDPGANLVVAVVPDFEDEFGQSAIYLTTRTHQVQETLSLRQRSAQPRVAAVDPCQSVLYVMVPQAQPMVAGALVDDADRMEMTKAVSVNGQGMTFEPYTRSLLLQQQSGDNYTVDAWSIVGTQLAPDIRKRLSNWAPPRVRPAFVSVAVPPRGVFCP